MSRIMFALIDAAERSEAQAQAISGVLNYLDYEGVIVGNFQIPTGAFVNDLLEAANPELLFDRSLYSVPTSQSEILGQLRKVYENNPSNFQEFVKVLRRVIYQLPQGRLRVVVTARGVYIDQDNDCDLDEALTIMRLGLFRLRGLMLRKMGADDPILLHEASSGEQAVVMSLLGIGSQITNGALICIDEPEVCLHPEWQAKYIELLYHTFEHYKDCHFLIATHSPQIVSFMPEGDCHVMTMEDGSVRSARDYARRSVDFQLAEVFFAPGYQNEYLKGISKN